MIPSVGCDPERNVVSMGAKVLEMISVSNFDLGELIIHASNFFSVSIDHVIIAIDWLYMIRAIEFHNGEVFLNAAR
jgi:hypothetical protein